MIAIPVIVVAPELGAIVVGGLTFILAAFSIDVAHKVIAKIQKKYKDGEKKKCSFCGNETFLEGFWDSL